jgi:outer membrane receptor protein involved in Fe transport
MAIGCIAGPRRRGPTNWPRSRSTAVSSPTDHIARVRGGGRLAYRTRDDRFGVSIWGRNLTNKYYYRSAIDITGVGFDYFHLGEPRTYGISFDAKL